VNLASELTAALQSAFEMMTGSKPSIECVAGAPGDSAFRWRQTFSAIPGALWIVAAEADMLTGGTCVLTAAGGAETDASKLKVEFMEVLTQALAALAQVFSVTLGGEVRCDPGEERAALPSEVNWSRFDIAMGEAALSLFAGAEPDLELALAKDTSPKDAPSIDAPRTVSKTFDLLLDVELPVSVSFGRAQVALKDVLKLTTGSIVELNRAMSDPVEVIVNDCVIARGEVVTIDGNFGVRIQEVISRQERLRNLK